MKGGKNSLLFTARKMFLIHAMQPCQQATVRCVEALDRRWARRGELTSPDVSSKLQPFFLTRTSRCHGKIPLSDEKRFLPSIYPNQRRRGEWPRLIGSARHRVCARLADCAYTAWLLGNCPVR
jgi:hypothetical protein